MRLPTPKPDPEPRHGGVASLASRIQPVPDAPHQDSATTALIWSHAEMPLQ